MNASQIVAKRLAIFSALYVALCIPAILIAERYDLPEWPMHTTQSLAILILIMSGGYYLYQTRGGEPSWFRKSIYILCGAGVIWVALIVAFVVYSMFFPTGPDAY